MVNQSQNRTSKSTILLSLCVAMLAIMPACKFNCSMGGMDKGKVESAIAEQMSLTGVTCPDPESTKAGSSFKCSGTDSEGTQKNVTVTFSDDNYNVTFAID